MKHTFQHAHARLTLAGIAATLAFALLGTGRAQASYVMECRLEGTVTSDPEVTHRYLSDSAGREFDQDIADFQFAVHRARANGRADGSCHLRFEGHRLNVTLDASVQPVKAIRKGDVIQLGYTHKDNEGAKPFEGYWLVPAVSGAHPTL